LTLVIFKVVAYFPYIEAPDQFRTAVNEFFGR
jgi:hypothetical protein